MLPIYASSGYTDNSEGYGFRDALDPASSLLCQPDNIFLETADKNRVEVRIRLQDFKRRILQDLSVLGLDEELEFATHRRFELGREMIRESNATSLGEAWSDMSRFDKA